MCGIVGGLFSDTPPERALREALALLHHRGPDDEGLTIDGRAALGMRRLSILDVANGRQPVQSESGRTMAVHNGEVYDYLEVARAELGESVRLGSRSDSAIIPPLYEKLGERTFAHLRGMFAIAIWDRAERRLLLGRDRFGKKPLYYALLPGNGIIFASELKALVPLARATGLPLRPREQAIYDFLSLGVVPQPDTIFEGVRCVPPGSYLRVDDAGAHVVRYWSLSRVPRRRPRGELLEEVRAMIAESVRLRLRSDVPLGVFLSGGIDSSIVAYEAARELGDDLRTFTVRVRDSALDESDVARRTAEHLGVQNQALDLELDPGVDLGRIVAGYDQPFADSSALPSLAVSRLAREHVTVVLNGDGGDEMFAGYRRHVAAAALGFEVSRSGAVASMANAAAPLLDAIGRSGAARRSGLGFAARLARGAARQNGARYFVWTTDMLLEADKRRVWRGGECVPTERLLDAVDFDGVGLHWQLAADQKINLLSDLLVKMDIATMAASLEARSPFLDHRLAELAATIPASQLLAFGRTKSVLRDAYRGKLPDEVLHAKKRGFEIPLARWLETDLAVLVGDLVLARDARVKGYLDPQFVEAVFAGRVLADRNLAYVRYALLVLEMWLRQWEERGRPS